MKKLPIAIAIAGSFTFVACRGDHSANSGRDTAEQHYNGPKTVDTAKVSSTDHSADGGTQAVKDTSVKKPK